MLDLDDIQALVFSGHGHMPFARFVLLRVTDSKLAKTWLRAAGPHIVAGTRRERGAAKPEATAHIALTCAGLQALGLDDATLSQFPREFMEGMSLGERPRVLGDTGDSAPEKWQFGGPNTPSIHVLLALYAQSEPKMAQLTADPWYPNGANAGLEAVFTQESWRKNDFEPFGFRDGISQPVVAGGPIPQDGAQPMLAPGEFLLGCSNEYANTTPAPTVPAALDTANVLPADSVDPAKRSFGLNGTYLVLRKLAQDVKGFWAFCDDAAATLAGSGMDRTAIWSETGWTLAERMPVDTGAYQGQHGPGRR